MTTIDRSTLVTGAAALLHLADQAAPDEPIELLGVVFPPGQGWRGGGTRGGKPALEPRPDAPFTRDPDGMPSAFTGAKGLWEAADRESWPGPPENGGGRFSKWDYLEGLQGLYVGALRREKPRFYLPDNPDKFEADVRWLGFSPRGRQWLAHLENVALLSREYCGIFGVRPVTRQRDGSLVELS